MTKFIRRRKNDKKVDPETAAKSLEHRKFNVSVAKHMFKHPRFGWRRWMEPYLTKDGEPIEQR